MPPRRPWIWSERSLNTLLTIKTSMEQLLIFQDKVLWLLPKQLKKIAISTIQTTRVARMLRMKRRATVSQWLREIQNSQVKQLPKRYSRLSNLQLRGKMMRLEPSKKQLQGHMQCLHILRVVYQWERWANQHPSLLINFQAQLRIINHLMEVKNPYQCPRKVFHQFKLRKLQT